MLIDHLNTALSNTYRPLDVPWGMAAAWVAFVVGTVSLLCALDRTPADDDLPPPHRLLNW